MFLMPRNCPCHLKSIQHSCFGCCVNYLKSCLKWETWKSLNLYFSLMKHIYCLMTCPLNSARRSNRSYVSSGQRALEYTSSHSLQQTFRTISLLNWVTGFSMHFAHTLQRTRRQLKLRPKHSGQTRTSTPQRSFPIWEPVRHWCQFSMRMVLLQLSSRLT